MASLEFVAKFLELELTLVDIDLKIQCCHRALGLHPPWNAPPRSFVINFLENNPKAQVLSAAWK